VPHGSKGFIEVLEIITLPLALKSKYYLGVTHGSKGFIEIRNHNIAFGFKIISTIQRHTQPFSLTLCYFLESDPLVISSYNLINDTVRRMKEMFIM